MAQRKTAYPTSYQQGQGTYHTSYTTPSYVRANWVAAQMDRGKGPGNTFATISTNPNNTYTVRTPEYRDPYAEMMERMSEAMALQAAMQAEYMNQMALLQEEQLRMQEEAAKSAMIENQKNPSDYVQANADDTARKQLLRRGLMSTFTRYGNANDGGGGKATKLGG